MGSQEVAFKEWAAGEGITVAAPIEQLQGVRLGIDAEDYVHSILTVGQREPLLPALGGLPFGLHKRLDDDLQHFREADITPVFIFNGLDLACRDRASIFRGSRKAEKVLNQAWTVYDEGKADQAVSAFGRAILYRSAHIVRNVQFYLHKQGVYTQNALYSAASQLVYMERESIIDAIAGSASCLVFGADKVVTGFEWAEGKTGETQTFNWVALSKCTAKLGMSRDQFINVCLLSGSSILPTLPEIDSDSPSSKIPGARSFVGRTGLDSNNLLHSLKDESYRDLFLKARFAIKHPVFLTAEGKIEPENWEIGPSDAHAFIGQRLPDELYGYLSYGIVGPKLLNWRTRMELLETQPLDGGDSEGYKQLVQDRLRPLRSQALSLMTRALHRYYQKHDAELICYWNEATKTPLNINPEQTDATSAADSWHVKTQALEHPAGLNPSRTPLMFAIMTLGSQGNAEKTITPRASSAPLQESDDLAANAVWRTLQHRGYINSDHTLSAWGEALKSALEQATSSGLMNHGTTSSEIEEAIFLAFELLRLDILNSKDFFPTPTYSGAPMRGSEADKANTLLVSRIASLGSFRHAEIGYTGPLSRHLLAYHQMIAAVRGALRDLVEMHSCHMLLANSVDRKIGKSLYKDFGASLPFLIEPDVGLALVVKTHLEESVQVAEKSPKHVGQWFIHASDIDGDLQKAWKMWDAINAGVQAADSTILNADVKGTFKKTDEWLTEKRRQPQLEATTNGTA